MTARTQREYWAFYWPLALTGAATLLGVQFQNASLARFPDAVTELAIFAIAHAVFSLFGTGLEFTQHLSAHFARSRAAARQTLRFVVLLATLLALAIGWVGGSTPGQVLVGLAFGVEASMLERVCRYLVWLAPVLLLHALRLYYVGLLIQARLTGQVTALNAIYLGVLGGWLLAGFALGGSALAVLVSAQAAATLVHALLARRQAGRHHPLPESAEPPPSAGRLLRFFMPLATTGALFSLSRPILYAFVARQPEGVVIIAALRVGFDFAFLFQQAANQFRHFFVSFGLDDLAGKRRFMRRVALGLTLIMLAVALSPLGDWLLRRGLGIQGEVLQRAMDILLLMTLMPGIIILRNYFHGMLIARERTGGMAWASLSRVLVIAALGALGEATGLLDHRFAVLALLGGFGVETLVVWWRAGRLVPD
ncbi:MAG: hypothetical protein CME40_03585 [Haliea sp.]|nr:hypothetical protein [Haliea sp.]